MLFPLCFLTQFDPFRPISTKIDLSNYLSTTKETAQSVSTACSAYYNATYTDPNRLNSKIKLRAETRHTGPQVEIQELPVPLPGCPSPQQHFLTPSVGQPVVLVRRSNTL
jgi:hypothetical protein